MPLPIILGGFALGYAVYRVFADDESPGTQSNRNDSDDVDDDVEQQQEKERERRKAAERKRIQASTTDAVNAALQTISVSAQPQNLSKPTFNQVRNFVGARTLFMWRLWADRCLEVTDSKAPRELLEFIAPYRGTLAANVLELDFSDKTACAELVYAVGQLGDLKSLEPSDKLQADMELISQLKKEISTLEQLRSQALMHTKEES